MKKSLGLLFLSFIPLTLGAGFRAAPAQAGETCNYINHNLYMAQAYQNNNQVWVSEGWWIVSPGQCIDYSDNVSTFFKFTEDDAVPRQPLPKTIATELCVVNDRFTVYQADDATSCEREDGSLITFTNIGNQKELLRDSYSEAAPGMPQSYFEDTPNSPGRGQFPLQGNFAY